MVIEFYYHPQSPPSCVVWMVLNELGLEYKAIVIDFFKDEQKGEAYAKVNPRKQVPAIKDGDMILAESRSIAIYLCNKFEKTDKKNKLYPRDLKEQAKFHEVMMRDVDNYQTILKYLNADDVFEGKSQSMVDALLPKCEGILQEYNNILSTSDYIFGSHITFLDFACAHTVSALAMSGYKHWEKYSNLMKWKANLAKLPYFEESLKKPVERNNQLFQLLLEKGLEAYEIFLTQQAKQ